MKKYVLGFAFTRDSKNIVLISKTKPDWQAGKFNGVGGKVEEGEKTIDAMIREFAEETGVETSKRQWEPFAVMKGRDQESEYQVTCFKMFDNCAMKCQTMEEERIVLETTTRALRMHLSECVPSFQTLLPLALNKYAKMAEIHFYPAT